MSRVIKNDDGVVVVEGTPAAKLVKDSDKFFASKPPERMAGESISQPKRIDPRAINTRSPIQREPDPRAINTRQPTPKDLEQMNNPLDVKGRQMIIPSSVEVGHTWKDMKAWQK